MNKLSETPTLGTNRPALSAILATTIATAPLATNCQKISDGIEEAEKELEQIDDAKSLSNEQKTLLEVQAYLEENAPKIKKYSELSEEDFGRNAGNVNNILEDLTEQVNKTNGAAVSISETNVRFSPNMLNKLKTALRLIIRELKGKLLVLGREAKRMRDSNRSLLKLYNRGAKWKGINPNSIIKMEGLVDELVKALQELEKTVLSLEGKDIKGCSNNSYVDAAITDKYGADHCDNSNTALCEAIFGIEAGLKLKELTRIQVAALQIRFAELGLKPGGVDGKPGGKTRKAYKAYSKDSAFRADVDRCEH